MLRTGNAAARQTRQLGAMEQQMRAIGTTIRYAFAGAAVFGVTSLIGKLNQLQQQMGLIAAIAPTAGVNFKGGELGQFINGLEGAAVDARTPVSELNDSVINFLSTVQNAPKNEIVDIVSQIGLTAKLSQTPTEDLTRSITTLNIAAGRANNLENINALLREWFQLISTAPGGIAAAPQIAQQLGPLSSVAQLGQLRPEQLFGFSLGALRFGATPSPALRGTQYFLQSLFQPGKGQEKYLSRAGFTPQRLEREGGAKFIMDYLKYVSDLGGGRGTSEKDLRSFGASVDANPDTEAALSPNQNIPGYSPEALKFLRNTIGRIHGIRTAAVLISQLQHKGQVDSIIEDLRIMDQLWRNEGENVNKLKTAQKRYQDNTPLQAAAVALNSLSLQGAQALAPGFNVAGKGLTWVQGQANRHPEETKWAIRGAAFAAALAGGARLLGLPGPIGALAGKITGASGRAFVAKQAIEDLATVGGAPGTSPTNPIYTIVVGQIFGGSVTGGGSGNIPGTNIPTPNSPAGKGWWSKILAPTVAIAAGVTADQFITPALKKEKKKGGLAGWLGETGLATIHMYRTIPQVLDQLQGRGAYRSSTDAVFGLARYGNSAQINKAFQNVISGKVPLSALPQGMQAGFSPLLRKVGQNSLLEATNNAMKLTTALERGFAKAGNPKVHGDVQVDMTITVPGVGKKDARVHVPLSTVYQSGTVPSSRGKRKSVRVDFSAAAHQRDNL